MKTEIKRLIKRIDRNYKKGLITKEQYQEHLVLRNELKKEALKRKQKNPRNPND